MLHFENANSIICKIKKGAFFTISAEESIEDTTND